jgi:Immunoglobulin I-set domain.
MVIFICHNCDLYVFLLFFFVCSDVLEDVEFPDILNEEASVNEGTNVTVRCFSDAVPRPTYSWSRKYKDFRGQNREEKIGDDNESGLLTLHNIMINETGEYKCIATNYPNIKKPSQSYSKQDTVNIKVICKLCFQSILKTNPFYRFETDSTHSGSNLFLQI